MIAQTFAALSHRASLLTLGTAGAAALAKPITANAKKNKTKTKKKAKKKCTKQVGQCNAAVIDACQGDDGCIAEGLPCCTFLGTCNMAGFVACIAAQGDRATHPARAESPHGHP